MQFFDTWAIQLFNISFTSENGLFFAAIHIIQICVAACLILLSLAVYSGENEKNSVYELIRENNELLFKETPIINEGDYKKILNRESSIENFKNSWESGLISTESFKEIHFCYNELLDNEKKLQEQKRYILESYNNYQKIIEIFKRKSTE